jgi:hypothetical protein
VQLVFGHDQRVCEWVSAKLGIVIYPPYTAIGATKDWHEFCAGAVFNNWNGSNIEITLYAPHLMTRGNIRAIFDYVFHQMQANRISLSVKRANKQWRAGLVRHGFEFEGVRRRYFGQTRADDAFMYGLFPEQMRKWT